MGRKALLVVALMTMTLPAWAQPFGYVASGTANVLYVFDTATAQQVGTISLPSSTRVGALLVSNDGTRVLATSTDASSIVVVNAQTNTVTGTIAVGPEPAALALSSDGGTVYVANSGNATVLRGGTTAGTTAGTGTQVNASPSGLALTSDGTKLYVSSLTSSSIQTINTSAVSITGTFALQSAPTAIALNAADTRLYAIDSAGSLTIADPVAGSVITRRSIGSAQLTSLAVSPVTGKVLITDGIAGTLSIVDGTTGDIQATVTTVGSPQSVAANPTGTRAYVVGRGGNTMTVVNLSTNAVLSTVTLSDRGERVALPRTTPATVTPQSGWWWNASESGRGFSFETNASSMFFAYYLYAADGTATWYLGTAATGGGYVSTLDQYAGGQTLLGAYKAATARGSSGQAQAVFFGSSSGALIWPGGTIPIQRFDIVSGGASSGPATGMPQTGWWWNPSEPGRGFFIEVQASTMYLAAFLYDDRGEPVWYSSQNTMTSTSLYTGTLTEYGNGQTLTGTYRAPTTSASKGTVSISFSSQTTGTLTLPNGTSFTIQRFAF